MGVSVFPTPSGGLSSLVKSVQRGLASSAGTVTITAVDVSKSHVRSFGTGAAGTAAISGNINAANGSESAQSTNGFSSNTSSLSVTAYNSPTSQNAGASGFGSGTWPVSLGGSSTNAYNMNAGNIGLNAVSLAGGSTNIIAQVYGASLTNSTTLTVTGACRWEVVEYN